MKNLTLFFLLALFFLPASQHAAIKVDDGTAISSQQLFSEMSPEAFLEISPRDIQAQTGEKMKLGDRIALRMAQRKVKKAMRNGEALDLAAAYDDAKGNFSIGGFLLGFFLGLLGVLIALLFGWDAVRSALLGMVVWLIAFLIIILV